ncbi:hypothetical protein K6119_07105 [Paracrocinitomix mangrovi]|uniref:hypothetical protein n=1 Tax=Paracrocinitomix mangrovi TaxID=2862509 RepID=UPI001C8EA492|nr:hypothetical protein [Paracrocinitomix mangrovi]UKN03280.1 hypothetical protein K6119_07105 [Paracrocinitomix mangrovi]
MKNHIFGLIYLILVLLFNSCSESKMKSKQTENNIVDELYENQNLRVQIKFLKEKTAIEVKKVNEQIFENQKLTNENRVTRLGDSLIFDFSNKRNQIYINVNRTEPKIYWEDFIFKGQIGDSKYWEILYGQYNCCSYSILLNSETGDTLNAIGSTFKSPSGKYLLSLSYSPNDSLIFNGFEIFKKYSPNYKRLGRFRTTNWSPYAFSWKNDNELILETKNSKNIKGEFRYAKMIIQEK